VGGAGREWGGGGGGGGGAGQSTRAKPEQRPNGGDLPRAVRVGVAGRPAGGGPVHGEVQRGGSRRISKVHVGAAVSQQPQDTGVQGLTLVHFSAQLEPFVWDRESAQGLCSPC